MVEVEGEYYEIPVEIASDQTVDKLKKEIKMQLFRTLAGIDAHRLKLYHIEIPTFGPQDTSKDIDYVAKAREEMSKPVFPPELDPQDKMMEIFKGTPPEDTIHIIVRCPPGRFLTNEKSDTLADNHTLSPTNQKYTQSFVLLKARITHFQSRLQVIKQLTS
jgi:hypothetical protein